MEICIKGIAERFQQSPVEDPRVEKYSRSSHSQENVLLKNVRNVAKRG